MEATAPENPRNPLTNDEVADCLLDLLRKHAGQLAEHFSSVQILCTNVECNGKTRAYQFGSGDVYARRGVARAFLDDCAREDAQ